MDGGACPCMPRIGGTWWHLLWLICGCPYAPKLALKSCSAIGCGVAGHADDRSDGGVVVVPAARALLILISTSDWGGALSQVRGGLACTSGVDHGGAHLGFRPLF